jgi:hypothetical protein
MRLRRVHLLASLAAVTAFAACTLNPQPLPPRDPTEDPENGATTFGDGGAFGSNSDAAARGPEQDSKSDAASALDDAGPLPPPNDADADAGVDAGDAGDASDADVN